MPELVRIAEEVDATETPLELKRDNKPIALITPIASAQSLRKEEKTTADYEAFKAAAGSWKDIDAHKLLQGIYENRRRTNTRPSVKV